MPRAPRRRLLALALLPSLLAASPAGAAEAVRVPPGNRHAEQPAVPGASGRRTAATRGSFDAKYEKIRALLADDRALQEKIRRAAADYRIAPVLIAGALVGEHTYNVDVLDRLQTYYVKAMSYMNSGIDFAYRGEGIARFVARPQFAACEGENDDTAIWSCRERVWDARFRGRSVDGASFPDQRFGAVFFQPFYAGQTFGLGQLNPLTALSVSDVVHRVSGYPELDMREAGGVYAAIMDPDRSLAYVAAVIRQSVDSYRRIAGFDISGNPGIVATLYNVGDPIGRAEALARENEARRRDGRAPRLPEENYYGWLVNSRLADLEAIFP